VEFENDIHSTGVVYHVFDIAEFEVIPETELADDF
jgi:hypothetical protein